MKRIIIPGILAAAVTGQHLDAARLHGHVVVLNFWGSWCAPCRAEAPVLTGAVRHPGASGGRPRESGGAPRRPFGTMP